MKEAKLGRLAALGKRALYLIDDPFSPLDAVTAMAVWQRVFAPGGSPPSTAAAAATACGFALLLALHLPLVSRPSKRRHPSLSE